MPRGTWTAPLILPLASSSGASRTSRMTTSSRFAIARTRAASSRGTTALAAASISFTPGIDFPPIGAHEVLVCSGPNRGTQPSTPTHVQPVPVPQRACTREAAFAARIVLLPSSHPRIGWPARRTKGGGEPPLYKPFAGLAALAAIGIASPASAQTELQWWHAMAGELGQKIEKLATDFNNSQKDFKVVPVYKGTYPEVMTGAIAAFRAKQPPHIIQVFEVGTATMMAARGAVYPVYELMKDAGEPFEPKAYLPAVVGYYTDTQGNLLSFPFNSSTPVLYYNKDLFKKAGLDPNAPPKTWPKVGAAAAKLQAAGVPCGFTSEWPSWINIENLSAWHNVPIATQVNGFGGLGTELKINGPVQVKHLAQLAEWQKTKLFDYGGRAASAEPKFNS